MKIGMISSSLPTLTYPVSLGAGSPRRSRVVVPHPLGHFQIIVNDEHPSFFGSVCFYLRLVTESFSSIGRVQNYSGKKFERSVQSYYFCRIFAPFILNT